MKTRRDEIATKAHDYNDSGSVTKRRKIDEGEDDSIPRLLDHSEYPSSPGSDCPTIVISNNGALLEQEALEAFTYQAESKIFQVLPTEVLRYCISFLGSTSDRFALQCTCRQFREWSDSEPMLRSLSLERFIAETDSPEKAQSRLHPFALARNIDAMYMFGTIRAYCFQDVIGGVSVLRVAKALGHLRSAYSEGIMLHDSMREHSVDSFEQAAKQGYLPSLQELLTATEIRERHGEINAHALEPYLDPECLTNLLIRHYESLSLDVRRVSSHCWNTRCGRWAYKQSASDEIFIDENSTDENTPQPLIKPVVASVLEKCKDVCDWSSLLECKLKNKDRPKVSKMKVCSSCRSAKYCSKFCQCYDWRSGRHRAECATMRMEHQRP